jgi:hypothetical protein
MDKKINVALGACPSQFLIWVPPAIEGYEPWFEESFK